MWVNGGSLANLLAVWRVHRIDEFMGCPLRKGVHHDPEATRRPVVHKLVGNGSCREARTAPTTASVQYRGERFADAFTELTGRGAYVVDLDSASQVHEERIEPELLS